jgi:hypothetical protein
MKRFIVLSLLLLVPVVVLAQENIVKSTESISTLASGEQPALRAPWEGKAMITQGNHGSFSHNVCCKREMDKEACNKADNDPAKVRCLSWENTYALDVQKYSGGEPMNFNVIAPADGEISLEPIRKPLRREK